MTGPHGVIDKMAIVAAINNDQTLENNLMRSALIVEKRVVLHCYRGFASAGAAYATGLEETESEMVVFLHQDVFLPDGWEASLARAVARLETYDPNWAVLGTFGLDTTGCHVGHVWSSGLGRRLGGRFDEPIEVTCLDELLIVVRRASGVRFDPNLPGYHLYGTDIVLSAHATGVRAYVADIPVIHNSRPVPQLGPDYVRAYSYMQRKWRHLLPLPTLITPIQESGLSLFRAKVRLAISARKRMARSIDPTTDPRLLVRHLDVVQDH